MSDQAKRTFAFIALLPFVVLLSVANAGAVLIEGVAGYVRRHRYHRRVKP